jgi:polyhydroxyalkanoate synthase
MAGEDTHESQAQSDGNLPGPDVMLRLWASWMDQMSAPAKALADPATAWWQMTTDSPASSLLAGGVNQLKRSLSQDPTLRSIDQMWNANPLREVVPVDWAEIARALRIAWLRSLRKPSTALAVTDLNQDLWRSAAEVWQEAGQRWLGMAEAVPGNGSSSAVTDKRFAAPEWHTNPVYRTLQQIYLLASDWLLQQGDVEQ